MRKRNAFLISFIGCSQLLSLFRGIVAACRLPADADLVGALVEEMHRVGKLMLPSLISFVRIRYFGLSMNAWHDESSTQYTAAKKAVNLREVIAA